MAREHCRKPEKPFLHASDRELLGCDLKYWEMAISGAWLRYLDLSQA